jgi:hypothetical protein
MAQTCERRVGFNQRFHGGTGDSDSRHQHGAYLRHGVNRFGAASAAYTSHVKCRLPLNINIGNDFYVKGIQIQVKTANTFASRPARHSNLQKCPFASMLVVYSSS